MARQALFPASEPHLVFQDENYIFQDENFCDSSMMMPSHAPMPSAPKPARQPLQSTNSNVILNPPNATSIKQSPFKSNSQAANSPFTPLKSAQGNKLNMVPMMPPGSFQPSTDSLEKKQPLMSRFKTVTQKPPHGMNLQYMGKENPQPTLFPASVPPQFNMNLPLESYYQKPSGKRVLLEAAPIKELRPAKRPRLNDPLPTPESFPVIMDDGAKPGHSYATLIGMAILRSPQRRLTLAQIYKWISDTFSFYNANDAGWQNSIRHNLSLNKHFIKQERPKDDPGKGNYWAIEPGAEHLFIKEKPSRKTSSTAENLPVMSTRLEPSHSQMPFLQEPVLPPQLSMAQTSLPPLPTSSQQPAAQLPEISSDATIPVSDMPTLDDIAERSNENGALNEAALYSPAPAAMHSSPPIPKRMNARRSGTPPPPRRLQGSPVTKSRSQKRRFTSMDDSGYISSLESSAMRPNQQNKLLTSEADRPRLKRGRAEEEIARLRASSYDSPSKGRSYGFPPASSSPLRQTSSNGNGQMLPPLTPAMKLKVPPKPPASVSPSTNLRLHRESIRSMMESPFKRVAALLPEGESVVQLTPGFSVDDFYGFDRKRDDDGLGLDIFEDSPFAPIFSLTPSAVQNGSPTKKSARRQRMDRSLSTSALHDVTSFPSLNASNSSFLKVPGQSSNNLLFDTPSKMFDGLPSSPSKMFLQSPSKMPMMNDENMAPFFSMDDLCTPDFLEDNDFPGIDMLAGFEKIGSSTAQPTQRGGKSSQKPSLGRCYTSTF
ncbi:hypothetical protein B0H63DRAFT_278106 [Podospora didyma]|uniref:Fork-head domain-containing protein n=1 Tax=Podospora didyma TaxID=330526 RepID=A0AAE0N9N7_9PEZI|nr:hypothetical protein B0H63DRAFT_278106 [Podospora didyma]